MSLQITARVWPGRCTWTACVSAPAAVLVPSHLSAASAVASVCSHLSMSSLVLWLSCSDGLLFTWASSWITVLWWCSLSPVPQPCFSYFLLLVACHPLSEVLSPWIHCAPDIFTIAVLLPSVSWMFLLACVFCLPFLCVCILLTSHHALAYALLMLTVGSHVRSHLLFPAIQKRHLYRLCVALTAWHGFHSLLWLW